MDEREKNLKILEQELNQLRVTYDLYFQGLERIPPEERRNLYHKKILRFQVSIATAPTALRYRVNSLLQRFTSYDQMWRRQMTAIENGTSRRDKLRASVAKNQKPTPLAAPAPLAEPAPIPMGNPALEAERLKKLHGAYVKAHEISGQKTSLTLDKLSASLKKQLPQLQQKHPGKQIDFKVVIKNGKAQLKAVVK